MRIDLYLKTSRLIKRRSLAQQACQNGLVLINDKIAKPSTNVNIDDIVTLNLGMKQIIVKVISLTFDKEKLMYQLISETYKNNKN